ncbi:ABC transporter ATP-binding protein [Paludisphaera rhizosphaerae]|uniref:ABC transporter ATP-binding protein n=1 Tax=Paludisphaera rhizosphaerae TaxID=2711216 RepID=UPI0013EC1B80|nr:ABC transporter ATP-binding protein [Paludisphaera rhizosphaerae]
MASIEFREVSRRYGANPPAVDSLAFDVADGERLVILGPSGSGKTTLLRLIAGLDQPTTGEILFDGKRIDGVPPHRRDVGMVFQEPSLHPFLDVAGNLEFGLRARGVPREERRRRVAEVASMLRLDGLLNRRPAALSGGERQRAAIGRAVVRRPAVLLLDEPFSSLDLPLRTALRRDLVDLHDRLGMTLIHVTHDQGEALTLGRRIAVMNHGRLIQTGTPNEVYDRPASPFVARFVGDPPMNLIPTEVAVDSTTGMRRVRFLPGAAPSSTDAMTNVEEGRILMGIRPELISVLRGGDEGSSLPDRATFDAVVGRLEYRGDSVLATLDLSGIPVVARVSRDGEFREGDRVVAIVDLDRVCLFSE